MPSVIIERLRAGPRGRHGIRVKIKIAGQTYSCQVEEPLIGEEIDPRTCSLVLWRELGMPNRIVIDTPEKQYKYVYFSIADHMQSILAGEAHRSVMREVADVHARNGQWDNTIGQPVAGLPPSPGRGVFEFHAPEGVINAALRSGAFTWAQEYPITVQRKRNSPERRAWLLLAKTIGRQKYRAFKKQGYFEVKGKRGKYRFHRHKQGGVTFIETRQYGEREVEVAFDLCIQSAATDLPEGDVIVSRYLAWKADEEAFLQTANFRSAHCEDEARTRNAAQERMPRFFMDPLHGGTGPIGY